VIPAVYGMQIIGSWVAIGDTDLNVFACLPAAGARLKAIALSLRII
jgi:hypothetical protein